MKQWWESLRSSAFIIIITGQTQVSRSTSPGNRCGKLSCFKDCKRDLAVSYRIALSILYCSTEMSYMTLYSNKWGTLRKPTDSNRKTEMVTGLRKLLGTCDVPDSFFRKPF